MHGRGVCGRGWVCKVRGGHVWQGIHCRGGEGACVAGKMVIAEGSMHPTGMHSCFVIEIIW